MSGHVASRNDSPTPACLPPPIQTTSWDAVLEPLRAAHPCSLGNIPLDHPSRYLSQRRCYRPFRYHFPSRRRRFDHHNARCLQILSTPHGRESPHVRKVLVTSLVASTIAHTTFILICIFCGVTAENITKIWAYTFSSSRNPWGVWNILLYFTTAIQLALFGLGIIWAPLRLNLQAALCICAIPFWIGAGIFAAFASITFCRTRQTIEPADGNFFSHRTIWLACISGLAALASTVLPCVPVVWRVEVALLHRVCIRRVLDLVGIRIFELCGILKDYRQRRAHRMAIKRGNRAADVGSAPASLKFSHGTVDEEIASKAGSQFELTLHASKMERIQSGPGSTACFELHVEERSELYVNEDKGMKMMDSPWEYNFPPLPYEGSVNVESTTYVPSISVYLLIPNAPQCVATTTPAPVTAVPRPNKRSFPQPCAISDDIVELDIADTSALSDDLAFERRRLNGATVTHGFGPAVMAPDSYGHVSVVVQLAPSHWPQPGTSKGTQHLHQ
ncbi:hypothetical protein F5148DRAFT_1350180 [Russula earlei]|uniref:Uncharacterized protein n=1 Tax=Russula earlei TaxID=71964 RepID=A0ACC0TTZ9_9AGAM|nr:hypothetical protein F5148DRAFT_1350180 [Russula earlei]